MARNYTITNSKKYPVTLIAHITGLSESTFTAASSSKGWSSKGGLTIEQISEILRMPRRNDPKSKWTIAQGREVIEGLTAFGINISNHDILNEFYSDTTEGYLPL